MSKRQFSDGADWVVADSPSVVHREWAARGGHLFSSASWGQILSSLGAQSLYAWHRLRRFGVCVPVFRRAGLRVGIFGFPVVGSYVDGLSSAELGGSIYGLMRQGGLDIVRLNRTRMHEMSSDVASARPEVWISDLQSWTCSASKRRRKDLAFARRANPGFQLSEQIQDSAACFRLYEATISSHGGALRYTPGYFGLLAQLAALSPKVRFVVALDVRGETKGFGVVAIDGPIGYYLHGAVHESARQTGVSDLILERLISIASDQGARQFSLLASPWSQSGLTRYKQKWGDTLGLSTTTDFAASLVGKAVTGVLRLRSYPDRREARRLLARD